MKKEFWTKGAGSYALAIFVALFVRWAFIEAYVIPSGSMLPNLLINDHIFVNKIVYGIRVPFSKKWVVNFSEPKPGEIIVFRYPRDEQIYYIKRVVGVGGDEVHWNRGRLFVNGEPVTNKEYLALNDLEGEFFSEGSRVSRGHEMLGEAPEYGEYHMEKLDGREYLVMLSMDRQGGASYGPQKIPEGMLLVMGDNRDNSQDSRSWGYVPMENLIGRASFVWLSCRETFQSLPFLCNPSTLRWKRFFHDLN